MAPPSLSRSASPLKPRQKTPEMQKKGAGGIEKEKGSATRSRIKSSSSSVVTTPLHRRKTLKVKDEPDTKKAKEEAISNPPTPINNVDSENEENDISQLDTQDISQVDTQDISQVDTQDIDISQVDTQDISQVDTQELDFDDEDDNHSKSRGGRGSGVTSSSKNEKNKKVKREEEEGGNRNNKRRKVTPEPEDLEKTLVSGEASRSIRKRKSPYVLVSQSTEDDSDEENTDFTETETEAGTEDEEFLTPDPRSRPNSVQVKRRRKSDDQVSKASKRLRKHTRALTQGKFESCSGIVKSLRVYNFMCHTGFHQDWHKNLNFITGENGSGKSAILSALLVGLGAKATVTSRTRSMTSLIQKGKDCARTEITLLNNGALTGRDYGHEIMIERTISKNGSSSYRIRGNGNIRKMKKHELDYILSALNIQLENPVAILNQEVAKNFLRTKDPKDKYKLFYSGTLLDQLFDLIEGSQANIDACQGNLIYHKERLEHLREEVNNLEFKLKQIENLRNIQSRQNRLAKEYHWARVYEEEQQITDLKKKIEEHESNIDKIRNDLQRSLQTRQTLEEELRGDKVREAQVKIRDKEREIEALRRDATEAAKAKQTYEQKAKTAKSQIQTKERQKASVEKGLEDIQKTSEEDKEKAIQEYEERKEQLQNEKSKLAAEIISVRGDRDQFSAAMQSKRAEMEEDRGTYDNYMRSLDFKKKALRDLESSQGSNRAAIFGRQMVELLKKIDANRRRFKKQPKGPVGAFVTVKDQRYAGIVEHVLKGAKLMDSFIVENSEDLLVLKDLIKQCYGENNKAYYPAVKVNGFRDRVYDTMGRFLNRRDGVSTLFEMVEVEGNDPVLLNALIDYVDAERVLLFESINAAAQVMKDQNRTAGAKCAYTLEFYRFSPSPGYKADALNMANGGKAKFLMSSKADKIQSLKTEVEELQQQVNQYRTQLDAKKREETEVRIRFDKLKALFNEKEGTLNAINRSIERNEKTKYKEPDISSYLEEVRVHTEAIEKLKKDIEKFEKSVEEFSQKLLDFNAKKVEAEALVNQWQDEIESSETARTRKQVQLQKETVHADRLKDKIRNLEKGKEPTMDQLKRSKEQLGLRVSRAEEQGSREVYGTTKNADDIKKELQELKDQIQVMQERLGDIDKLKKDYKRKKNDFDGRRKQFAPVFKMFTVLKELVKMQYSYLLKKRDTISNLLKLNFEQLAQKRGYKGQMTIEHEKQELHFFICPDQSSTDWTNEAISTQKSQSSQAVVKKAAKNLMEYSLQLSGGERSFSTICFILSLWQVMECPFYMLDEFDVFMDAFNRKVSQQALMAHARQHKDRQFFLFSPLDLVEIPSKEEANVIRLRPARPDPAENGVSAAAKPKPRSRT